MTPYGNHFVIGDFNGNGKTDYITILSNGTGYKPFLSFPDDNNYNNLNNEVIVPTANNPVFNYIGWNNADLISAIDYDGDGKNELMVVDGLMTSIYAFEKTGNQWYANRVYYSGYPTMYHDIYFGDFNGDGKTDLLTKTESELWEKAISKGEGNSFVVTSAPSFRNPPEPYNQYIFDRFLIADFNGDGMSDVARMYNYSFGADNLVSNAIDFYYSTGNDFYYDQPIDIDFPIDYSRLYSVTGDFNGDGRADMSVLEDESTFITPILCNPNDKSCMLHCVANGFNNTSIFEYDYLTTGNNYTKGQASTYPLATVQAPMAVVRNVQVPDGIGGINQTDYAYEEAKVHLQGKGFLGFKKVISENSISNIKSITENQFNTAYYTATPHKQYTYLLTGNNNEELISQTTHTNAFVSKDNNTRYWIKPLAVANDDYLADRRTFTINTFNDTYGNLMQSTSTVQVLGEQVLETQVTTYENYNGNCAWMPNKPELVTTTTTRQGEAPYTSSMRKYYNANGAVWKTVDYPNTEKAITTTYTNFNVFGIAKDVSVSATGQTTRTTTMEYEPKGRFVTKTTNALDQFKTAKRDPRWGKPLETVSIDGLKTTYRYDGFGRVKETTTPNGNIIVNSWNWDIRTGDGTSMTTADNAVYYTHTQHPGKPDIKTWYDQFGRERETASETFDNQWLHTVKSYDHRGNVRSKTAPFFAGTAPAVITTYTYEDDLSASKPEYYNALTTAANSAGTTTYTYDVSDGESTVTVTNPANQVSSSTTDVTGKTIRTTDHGGTLTMDYYSHGGQKNTMMGNVELVRMEYDDYARQTALIDKNAGRTDYIYNAFGELEYQKDAKGHETFTYYDVLGRVDYMTLPEGTIDYQYVTSGNGLGQVKKIINYTGSTKEYVYDQLSRLYQLKETIDGTVHTSTYAYDNYNNNTSITYPSGFGIQKIYDSNGFLTQVTNANGNTTIFDAHEVNHYGQYTRYTLGNGLQSQMAYDDYGFPTNFSAGNVQNLSMNFDWTTGNMQYRHDYTKNKFESFSYDNLNRLKTASILNGASINTNYAANGNISFKTDAGSYTYDPTKIHAVKTVTNAQGVIPTRGTQTVTSYTSFEQPNRILYGKHDLTFWYGSDLNREKTVLKDNTTDATLYTRYFFGDYEKTTTAGSTQHLHYITCGDGLNAIVIRENGTDTYYYTYQDHLGSIVAVTDATGNVVAEQNFDPWGRFRNPDTWTYDNIPTAPDWLYRGYTAHEHLPQFDLINMNGRLYDPVVGRMLSPDNVTHGGTQGYNRYSYALNNPLKYTDPNGETPLLVVAIAITTNVIANGFLNTANNRPFFENAGRAVVDGAFAGISAVGIGGIVGGAPLSWGKVATQIGLNGLNQAAVTSLQGGSFWQGAASGAVSSAIDVAVNFILDAPTRGQQFAYEVGTPDGSENIYIQHQVDYYYADGSIVNIQVGVGADEALWTAVTKRRGGYIPLAGYKQELLPIGEVPELVRLGGADGLIWQGLKEGAMLAMPIPPVIRLGNLANYAARTSSRILSWGKNSKGHLIKHADALGFGNHTPQELQKMLPELRGAANQLLNNANPALTRVGNWNQVQNAHMYISNGKMLVTRANGEFLTVINKTANKWYNAATPLK